MSLPRAVVVMEYYEGGNSDDPYPWIIDLDRLEALASDEVALAEHISQETSHYVDPDYIRKLAPALTAIGYEGIISAEQHGLAYLDASITCCPTVPTPYSCELLGIVSIHYP